MKLTSPQRLLGSLMAGTLLSLAQPVRAQTLYWPGGNNTGTWATSVTAWSSTPGGSASLVWTQSRDAVIQGTAPSITVGTASAYTVNVTNLTVQNGVSFIGANANRNLYVLGSGTGNVALEGTGTGYLRFYLSGTSAYSGTVTAKAQAGNTVVLTNDTGTGTATKIHLDGGTLALDSTLANKTATIGELSGTGTVTATLNTASGTRRLRIEQATDTTFNGFLEDTASNRRLALTKAGSGTLILSGSASYFGGTTVEAGRLFLNGMNVEQNNYTVQSGAKLGGSGTILFAATYTRAVSIQNGGILSPGGVTQTGTLTIGGGVGNNGSGAGLRFEGNARIEMRLGTLQDKIVLSNVDMAGYAAGGVHSILFDFQDNGGTVVNGVYDLIVFGANATPSITLNKFGLTDSSVAAGWDGSFAYNGNILQFTVTAVPEPGAVLLLSMGGALALLVRRKIRS